MRKIKKMLALVIAAVMIVGTMSISAFAEAADGSLDVDEKVTVTGLEKGDTVAAWQFITWVDGEGWKLADGLVKLDSTTAFKMDDITDGLDKDELAALAKQTSKMTAITDGALAADGESWERACGTMEKAGSYLILATANDAQHVYNPAVVSADFSADSASTVALLTSDTATVKKQNVTLDKEVDNEDDYDVQVGDIVDFTVSVTVPQYNDNWTEPTFQVTDVLSDGLTISTLPTIAGLTEGEDEDYVLSGAVGDGGFTITFNESYLKENASTGIEIKYSALVGEDVKDTAQVHEETNKVTLTFSNNPQNSGDHKTIEDETHHYTFAIDASRFGSTAGGGSTNELIKVGVDSKGNVVTRIQEDEEWSEDGTVAPLAGAEFTLTGTGPNGIGTYTATATSDENGRLFFNNLEAGTYTLTETKAPAGYIKDDSEHTVKIEAEYDDDGILLSYTITIDSVETTNYTATTDAATSKTKSVVRDDDNEKTPIVNTKGVELPSTGGMGTTLFYIIGAILVLGAGILLVTRRRMSAN